MTSYILIGRENGVVRVYIARDKKSLWKAIQRYEEEIIWEGSAEVYVIGRDILPIKDYETWKLRILY